MLSTPISVAYLNVSPIIYTYDILGFIDGRSSSATHSLRLRTEAMTGVRVGRGDTGCGMF
jgi:hypothetical protein